MLYLRSIFEGRDSARRATSRNDAARLALVADAFSTKTLTECSELLVAHCNPLFTLVDSCFSSENGTGGENCTGKLTDALPQLTRLIALIGAIASARPPDVEPPMSPALANYISSLKRMLWRHAELRAPTSHQQAVEHDVTQADTDAAGVTPTIPISTIDALHKSLFALFYLDASFPPWNADAQATISVSADKTPLHALFPPGFASDLAVTIELGSHLSYVRSSTAIVIALSIRLGAASLAALFVLWSPMWVQRAGWTGMTWDFPLPMQLWRPLISGVLGATATAAAITICGALCMQSFRQNARARRYGAVHFFLCSDSDIVRALTLSPTLRASNAAVLVDNDVAGDVKLDGGDVNGSHNPTAEIAVGNIAVEQGFAGRRTSDGAVASTMTSTLPQEAIAAAAKTLTPLHSFNRWPQTAENDMPEELILGDGEVIAETEDGTLVALTRDEAAALLGRETAEVLAQQTAMLLRAAAARLAGSTTPTRGGELSSESSRRDDADGVSQASIAAAQAPTTRTPSEFARPIPRVLPATGSISTEGQNIRLNSDLGTTNSEATTDSRATSVTASSSRLSETDVADSTSTEAHFVQLFSAPRTPSVTSPLQQVDTSMQLQDATDDEVGVLADAINVPRDTAESMLAALASAAQLAKSSGASPQYGTISPSLLPTLLALYRQLAAVGEETMAQGVADLIVIVGDVVSQRLADGEGCAGSSEHS